MASIFGGDDFLKTEDQIPVFVAGSTAQAASILRASFDTVSDSHGIIVLRNISLILGLDPSLFNSIKAPPGCTYNYIQKTFNVQVNKATALEDLQVWVALILCSIGKSVSTYLDEWIRKRIKGISRIVSNDEAYECICPPGGTISQIIKILDGAGPLRRALYEFSCAHIQSKGELSAACSFGLRLSKFSRMGPFVLIIERIVVPERIDVCSIRALTQEVRNLGKAIQKFKTTPAEHQPFFYHRNEDMTLFERSRFPQLARFSFELSLARESPTLSKYLGFNAVNLCPELERLREVELGAADQAQIDEITQILRSMDTTSL